MSLRVAATTICIASLAPCAYARFLSPDPVPAEAGDTTHDNRYAYAHNAPFDHIDPDGRWGLRPYHQGEGAPVLPTPGPAISRLPTESGYITSHYGPRTPPVAGAARLHNGTDFRARHGHTVHSTQNGQVVKIFAGGSGGNQILVHNHDGSLSGYAHTRARGDLREGSTVRRGEPIGTSDGSGRITAPHLHYTYRPGTVHDPAHVGTPTADAMKTQLRRYFGK